MERRQENLIKFVESISEQIQVLALNIAVAAARMSARKELNIEINSKLSKLVSQATLAVKNMNHVLQAAGAEKTGKNIAENIHSLPDLIESAHPRRNERVLPLRRRRMQEVDMGQKSGCDLVVI